MRVLQPECSLGLEPVLALALLLCDALAAPCCPRPACSGALLAQGAHAVNAQALRLSWDDGCLAACSPVLRAAERSTLLTASVR